MEEPFEPAAPKARRQNCRREEASCALDLISARAWRAFLVLLLLQNLQPVDDRADRRDNVVADAGREQGREIEGVEREFRHGVIQLMIGLVRDIHDDATVARREGE